MTITSVALKSRKMRSGVGERTAEDIYQVITDNPKESLNTIRTATDPSDPGRTNIFLYVPERGDQYEATDTALRVKEVDVQQPEDVGERISFTVRVLYSTGVVGDEEENPLDEDPIVNWDDQETSEPVFEDNAGNAIINSAGQTFDPGVEKQVYDALVTIQRNIEEYDEVTASTYRGKVNADQFFIRGASSPIAVGVAKVVSYRGAQATKNGVSYWVETIIIATRADGWTRHILDEGYATRNGSDELVTKLDANNLPTNQPVLLDGAGDELAFGDPAVFMDYDLEDTVNFSGMGLPTS